LSKDGLGEFCEICSDLEMSAANTEL
jgi:hypothetical protein